MLWHHLWKSSKNAFRFNLLGKSSQSSINEYFGPKWFFESAVVSFTTESSPLIKWALLVKVCIVHWQRGFVTWASWIDELMFALFLSEAERHLIHLQPGDTTRGERAKVSRRPQRSKSQQLPRPQTRPLPRQQQAAECIYSSAAPLLQLRDKYYTVCLTTVLIYFRLLRFSTFKTLNEIRYQ